MTQINEDDILISVLLFSAFILSLQNYIRDITDTLISLSNDREENNDMSMLSNSQIIHTVIDIFGAGLTLEKNKWKGILLNMDDTSSLHCWLFFSSGFDTIIAGLQWSLLYLIKFPDIQNRIHQEIGTVSSNN